MKLYRFERPKQILKRSSSTRRYGHDSLLYILYIYIHILPIKHTLSYFVKLQDLHVSLQTATLNSTHNPQTGPVVGSTTRLETGFPTGLRWKNCETSERDYWHNAKPKKQQVSACWRLAALGGRDFVFLCDAFLVKQQQFKGGSQRPFSRDL